MGEKIDRIGAWAFAAACLLFFLVTLDGPFGPLNNLRFPAILAAVAFVIGRRILVPHLTELLQSRSFVGSLTAFAAVVFVRIKWLEFEAGAISGVDFSHLDYAIWSTAQGRFMQIPILPPQSAFLDFFGNHYSPILFFHVAARAFWDSPLASLTVHGLSLALAIPVLHRLARQWTDDLTASLLALVYFFCGSVASTLQFDIHQESFYPLALGLLFCGLRGPRWASWVGLALCLTIKEDAGLYLAPFFLLAAWRFPARRFELLAQAFFAAAAFVFILKVAMPWHQPPRLAAPYYLPMWAKYGSTFGEVAKTMGLHPHWVARDLFLNAALYKNLLPWAFLPFFSLFGLTALAPAVVAATGSGAQHAFGLYYGIVLVPFFYLAACEVLASLTPPRRHRLALAMLFAASLVGGGFLKLPAPSPSFSAWDSAGSEVARAVGSEATVWVQSGLLPYLPYETRWKRIDAFAQIPAADGKLGVVLFDGVENGLVTEPRQTWEPTLAGKGYRKVAGSGGLSIFR